jgi:hypothetical protein
MPIHRLLLWLGKPPRARWLGCAIGVGAGLSSCGGRAADGPGLDDGEPEVSDARDQPGDAPSDEPTLIRPRRETCEDNPLLADCPYAGGGNPTSTPAQPVGVPTEDPPLYLAAAQNVLMVYCGACHGPPLTPDQASARINYINDWEQLIRVGLIEECSPERSRIVEVMRTGEMPPPNSGVPAVQEADANVVVQAIEIECYTR